MSLAETRKSGRLGRDDASADIATGHDDARYALVVEDHALTRAFVKDVLVRSRFEVMSAGDAAEALALLDEFDFDVAVVDLHLGQGPSGTLIIDRLQSDSEWTAVVVLTSFGSPSLVDIGREEIPGVEYVQKSQITGGADLAEAVERATSGRFRTTVGSEGSEYVLTPAQAAILSLIARGLSNDAIAVELDMSRRAVEHAIRRLFRALNLEPHDMTSRRIQAVNIYRTGSIRVARRKPVHDATATCDVGSEIDTDAEIQA